MKTEPFELAQRIHLLGISGAGMLPLAICLKQSGREVSGQDDSPSADAKAILDQHKIELAPLEKVEGEDVLVVHSSALQDSHPSMKEAERRGLTRISRGRCLARLAQDKRLIAVAGSHGKTSTTGILIDLLEGLGEEPSYVLGGLFATGKDPGRWNDAEWMVVELDESDGTIEAFTPEVSVILNVDHDHHTKYRSEEDYQSVFRRLAERTTGKVVMTKSLLDTLKPCRERGDLLDPESLDSMARETNQVGRFSRSNQLHALAAAKAAGFTLSGFTLKWCTPIKRRQSCLYFSPELKVVEDYAHHPAEIAAIREGLKPVFKGAMIAVFQPHRYSRTRSLKRELARELSHFDYVYLTDVYGASENPVEGGSGQDLFDACRSVFEHCEFRSDGRANLPDLYRKIGDSGPATIVFLGAGRTDVLAREFVDEMVSRDCRWGGLYSGLASVLDYSSKIRSQEKLDRKTTLRVGGRAEVYYEPASERELLTALRICHEKGLPVYPLGRGSNLIVPDSGVSGLVMRLSHPFWRRFEKLGERRIRVGAGLRIKELCGLACQEGLEGFEFLEGIPGSVGGALRMNAGAMGGWMFDVVKSLRFATLEGQLLEAKTEDLSVGYRHCRELVGSVALDAILEAKAVGQKEAELRKAIDVYQSKRKESQPREPSAGCIFKNPEGGSAGQLIDELGLKGTVIGGAEISTVHGNFIINRGGATSEDVIELVRLVRRVAKARRSVELEPEALLYGEDWSKVLA